MKVPFSIVDNHIVLSFEGKKAIVDTGSPLSFASKTMEVLEHRIPVVPMLSAVLEGASEKLLEIQGDCCLLGLDVLKIHTFLLDRDTMEASIDEAIPEGDRGTYSLGFDDRVFSLDLKVEGKPSHLIFDTGAGTSYIKGSFLDKAAREGLLKDWSPEIGDIEAEGYKVSVEDFGSVVMGKMPSRLETYVEIFGDYDGILGLCSLQWRRCYLDLGRGAVSFCL